MTRAEFNARIERAKFERECYRRTGGFHKVDTLTEEIAVLERQRDELPAEPPVTLPPVEPPAEGEKPIGRNVCRWKAKPKPKPTSQGDLF